MTAAGTANCAQVGAEQLTDIETLDVSYAGITTLKEGDFDGLTRVKEIDLGGNVIEELVPGIFDPMLTTSSCPSGRCRRER